jgi:receptor expression-enhancing protein 1/2/3/4
VHLAPLLRGHEDQIDSALTQVKFAVYEFVQEKLRLIWSSVIGGTPPSATATGATSTTNVAAVNPPSMNDPLSGAAQMVSGWWNAYAPAIVATGAAYIATKQQAAETALQQRKLQSAKRQNSAPISGPQSKADRVSSKEARRRELEAELAALAQAPSSPIGDPISSGLSSSSSYSLHGTQARRRKESDSDGDGGRYETIAKDDVTSSSESIGSPTTNRKSWWNWRSSTYQDYERVKTD